MAISACIDFTLDRWYNSTIYVRHASDKRKVHLMKNKMLVVIALVAIVVTGCVSRAPKKVGLPTPSNEKEVPRHVFLWFALLLAILASGCTMQVEHRSWHSTNISRGGYGAPPPYYYYNGPVGTTFYGYRAPRYVPQPQVSCPPPQPRQWCPPHSSQSRGNGGHHNAAGGNIVGHR